MKKIKIRNDVWVDEYILFDADTRGEKLIAYKIKNHDIEDKFECPYRVGLQSFVDFIDGLPLLTNCLVLTTTVKSWKIRFGNDIILPHAQFYALDNGKHYSLRESKGKGKLERKYGIGDEKHFDYMLRLVDTYEYVKEAIKGGSVIDSVALKVNIGDGIGTIKRLLLIDGEVPERDPDKDPKYKKVLEYIKQNAPRKVEAREIQDVFSMGVGRAVRLLECIKFYFPKYCEKEYNK